jgi:hypothetical protein
MDAERANRIATCSGSKERFEDKRRDVDSTIKMMNMYRPLVLYDSEGSITHKSGLMDIKQRERRFDVRVTNSSTHAIPYEHV